MPTVFIPRRLRPLTSGQAQVDVCGASVRQVIEALNDRFPGMKDRLYDGERDALAAGIAVTVDGVTSELGLLAAVDPEAEVHFLPAIAGG